MLAHITKGYLKTNGAGFGQAKIAWPHCFSGSPIHPHQAKSNIERLPENRRMVFQVASNSLFFMQG
ncbi:hypothetical protein [Eikenella corrodens]|uniref:Uncharacterized protein n=1 Tax=Eikenella corrodens TaxID=539 RepID=A0A3S9SLX5_EIKCO|nr:hypothetical protein [Eikenella corrodens]AZR60453.1 hypothetical protein ELB75_10820 [Eikenella corrodens]